MIFLLSICDLRFAIFRNFPFVIFMSTITQRMTKERKPEITNQKSQIENHKSQIIENHKSTIENLNPEP